MIKCLIWDLDGTLFRGTISEDSAPPVEETFRRLVIHLADHGVISSVASRNDEQVGLAALERVGLRDFLVHPQISWEPKSQAIKRIITDLNLRPQDVLFVDDRAFERDEVRHVLPDIRTIDPVDLQAPGTRAELLAGSVDRGARLRMYKDEERRLQDRRAFGGTNEAFLRQCAISMRVRSAADPDIVRVAELLVRTNQLNSSKLGLTGTELGELLDRRDTCLLVAEIADRYGDYGLSAAALGVDDAPSVFRLDALVISCRLMGRGIAQAMLAAAAAAAVARGRDRLICRFNPSEYNRQMHLLFSFNGFVRQATGSQIVYAGDERASVRPPPWVQLQWPWTTPIRPEPCEADLLAL